MQSNKKINDIMFTNRVHQNFVLVYYFDGCTAVNYFYGQDLFLRSTSKCSVAIALNAAQTSYYKFVYFKRDWGEQILAKTKSSIPLQK